MAAQRAAGKEDKLRWYVFTLNNPKHLLVEQRWGDAVVHSAYQLEVGEEGVPHYQGILHLKNPMRPAALHKLAGLKRAWFGVMGGTWQQALAYATKTDDTYVDGPWFWPSEAAVRGTGGAAKPGQGARNDLNQVADLIKDGASLMQIADQHTTTYIKFNRGIQATKLLLSSSETRAGQLDSILYLGPSGTGKSRRLLEECPPGPDWYWVEPGKWFDNYDGQGGLVLNDVRDTWMPLNSFLRLVDAYPLMVETKGGQVTMKATKFRMSSNVHPISWYQGVKEVKDREQWEGTPLWRRFSKVVYMKDVWVPPEPIVEDDGLAQWLEEHPEQDPTKAPLELEDGVLFDRRRPPEAAEGNMRKRRGR